jgi:hypothetical protein
MTSSRALWTCTDRHATGGSLSACFAESRVINLRKDGYIQCAVESAVSPGTWAVALYSGAPARFHQLRGEFTLYVTTKCKLCDVNNGRIALLAESASLESYLLANDEVSSQQDVPLEFSPCNDGTFCSMITDWAFASWMYVPVCLSHPCKLVVTSCRSQSCFRPI